MLPLISVSSSRLSTMSNASTLRKRRGVVRASITRLTSRLRDLESDTEKPAALDLAQGMIRKLNALNSEFRTHHQALVDLIDDEEAIQTEQKTLDTTTTSSLNSLYTYSTSSTPVLPRLNRPFVRLRLGDYLT